MTAVRIENVTKSFGTFVAVDDLSLEVPAAPSTGSLGPTVRARRPPYG